jgi:hypothetical protein
LASDKNLDYDYNGLYSQLKPAMFVRLKSITMSKIAKFIAGEALNLSVGYLAGLSASMLVNKFFVKKGLVNLWGLAAKRDALKKDTYEWVMFIASYLIGLIVMILVNYLLQRLRNQKPAEQA